MTARKLVLGSASGLLISAALAAGTPALAQQDPAQAYSSARAQYESQLADYQQKQQAYERQRSEYNAKLDAYQRALNAPAPAPDRVVVVDDPDPDVVVIDRNRDTAVIVDEPAPPVVLADRGPDVVIVDRDDFAQRLIMREIPSRLVRVEDVPNANHDLFNAVVVDAAGIPVGHFRRIEAQSDGDVVAVVTLNNSRRTISMATEHVRLDAARGIVIADMTARQIDTIPSGFPYG
jgi:glucose/arabinose dehydrogenase